MLKTTKVKDSILLMYEEWPEQLRLYWIPTGTELDSQLLTAIKRSDGLYYNAVERGPETEQQQKACAYVQAAVTEQEDHLDEENAYKQARVFAMLVPFKVREYGFSSASASTVRVIRTGILL